MAEALAQGASGFTHLFNAMSPLGSREPGVVGAALESQTAWCGIIVDGRHVDPVTLKIALRTRPLDRFMLVSDAMPTVGMADKSFDLQGRPIYNGGYTKLDLAGSYRLNSSVSLFARVENLLNQSRLRLTFVSD